MNFKITLTDDDFIAFNLYYILHGSGRRPIFFGRISILIVAVILLVFSQVYRRGFSSILVEGIVLLVFAIIWFFFYPKLVQRNIGRKIIKLRREAGFPYESDIELSFTETGIIEKTEATEKETPYEDFREITETDAYIYLAKKTPESMIIPRRCIPDQEAFLEYLRGKI